MLWKNKDEKNKAEIKIGIIAEDKITGFKGTITGKAEYLCGCDQYLLTPKSEENEYKDSMWIDEGRLIPLAEEGINPEDVQVEKNGGPCRRVRM